MKIYFILLIFMVFIFILIGCSTTTITINENNLKENYSLRQGDIVEVVLNANPSTGYEWQIVNIDTSKVKIVNKTYTANNVNKDKVGSGGIMTYHFEAISKGNTAINITYFRSFEKELPPKKKFEINLEIK